MFSIMAVIFFKLCSVPRSVVRVVAVHRLREAGRRLNKWN
jgi:hypothetical protein